MKWNSLGTKYPSGRKIPKRIRDKYKKYLQKHLDEEHPTAKRYGLKVV